MNRKDKTENSVNKVHVWSQFQNSIRLLGSQKRRYMLLLLLETLLNGLSPAITLVITQQMINALQTMKQDFQPVLLYVKFQQHLQHVYMCFKIVSIIGKSGKNTFLKKIFILVCWKR